MKRAFTLLELVFVIVVIGVLASVAIPKLSGLTDNAKISAEMQTASAVQTAIDAIHTEWVTNRCEFNWGPNKRSSDPAKGFLNANGYPVSLGNNFSEILSNVHDWTCTGADGDSCTGPASGDKGTSKCKANKPCKSKSWSYSATNGTFTLK